MPNEMLMTMPIFMLARMVDFTNEDNLMYARIGFFTVQVLVFSTCFYLYNTIKSKNDQKKIKTPPPPPNNKVPESQWIETTVMGYDMEHLQKLVTKFTLQAVLISFIHYKWEIAAPLMVQTFVTPMHLYKNELVQIHIFGSTAPEHDRPFPDEKTPFDGLLPTPEPEQQESETPPAGTIEEVSEESEESPKEVKEEAKKETKEESGKKEEETGGKKREVLDALDDSEITNDATSKEDLLLVD